MVYTSRNRFEESCNELSGMVMFMDIVFRKFEERKEVLGIVVNSGREKIVMGKI